MITATSDHSDKISWLIANLKVATQILRLVYLILIYATFHEIACPSNLDYFFGCSYMDKSSTPFCG